ncbi:SAV_2336 N-terminal domain-related protein [Streptomyces sp. NPDC059071]|uniref:SAV_2336 N-terminal domain-related protein n=1 Tax=unclassified Streptomyces TaxID=2593676 RepID=UPI003667F547
MTPDRRRDGSGALAALAGLLGEAGEEPPTGRELAELLWLARELSDGDRPGASEPPETDQVTVHGGTGHTGLLVAPPRPAPPPATPSGSARSVPPPPAPRVPLHTPVPGPVPEAREAGHAPLLAPAPPMLARPLALQRSLRPLRRTVPSGAERELDEAATADRIAALAAPGSGRRLWLPVLRPRQERWLHLRLVVDSGPTMTMWRPLARELHTAFAQTGAFRTLDVLRLGEDGLLPPRHRERGRTAVLVLSDAMGPQWRDGPAGLRWRGALAALAQEGPVALLQPLPERMWRHTAAPAVPGRFVSPAAGVPNTALGFTPYDGPSGALDGVPLPVLEPSDVWLGNWAALVASPSGAEVPGAAAFVHVDAAPVPPDDELAPAEAHPEDLVLRFRALASPQAFRLAAHLAVGSAHLPVMRLVQAAIEARPEPRHLAEVVLSGMLRADPGGTPGAYDFRPGVREVLLSALPRTSLVATARLLSRVSAEVESRAGALPGEFRALVESLEGRGPDRAVGRPFALVSEESVRLLRGPERPAPPVASRPAPDPEVAEAVAPPVPRAAEPASAPPPLDPDRYEVGERLGGHVVQVWRGYDRYLRREVALSFYPLPAGSGIRDTVLDRDRDTPSIASTASADFLARGYQVAELLDLHLLRVYDALVLDEGCCLVTEPRPGRSLRQVLDEAGGPLPVPMAVLIAQGILGGLVVLHDETGLAHGNLTPEAVLGVGVGPLRLAEPGVLWPVMEDHGDPARTARYRAPESRPGRPTEYEDLYALGCVLYEMLTGSLPSPGVDLLAGRADLPDALIRTVANLRSRSARERRRGAVALSSGFNVSGSPQSSPLDFRVLGPLRVSVRGREVDLDDRDKVFVARLLLAQGAPVTAAQMREALGDGPREVAEDCVRRLLDLGIAVDVRESSYTLHVPDNALDLSRALSYAEQARAALADGDRRALARTYLTSALALWYGEPLAGLDGGAWADGERALLQGWRATIVDDLAALETTEPSEGTAPASAGRLIVRRSAAGPELSPEVGALVVGLVRDYSGEFGGLSQPRASHVVHAPIPPGIRPADLVGWVTGTFPQALADRLPAGAALPVRLNVVVREGGASPATALALVSHEDRTPLPEGALVAVTVVISHELRAGLPRALRRSFRTITATAGGRQHTVVVARPPGGPPSDHD